MIFEWLGFHSATNIFIGNILGFCFFAFFFGIATINFIDMNIFPNGFTPTELKKNYAIAGLFWLTWTVVIVLLGGFLTIALGIILVTIVLSGLSRIELGY